MFFPLTRALPGPGNIIGLWPNGPFYQEKVVDNLGNRTTAQLATTGTLSYAPTLF